MIEKLKYDAVFFCRNIVEVEALCGGHLARVILFIMERRSITHFHERNSDGSRAKINHFMVDGLQKPQLDSEQLQSVRQEQFKW